MRKGKVRTRTSGTHQGQRYPINDQGPQGYSIAKGNPTSKGVTRADLRAAKMLKSRHPIPQREFEARNVIIHSPEMSRFAEAKGVEFKRDKEGGPNPMAPVVRRVDKGKEWDQKRDEARLNKRVLDPTNPTHQAMWMDHPERYDMADVDTPFRDDDEITLFRGVRGQVHKKKLSEYNRPDEGLGQYWTGNIQVARMYAVKGTVTIDSAIQFSGLDKHVTDKLESQREQRKNLGEFGIPLERTFVGVLFKYDAKGKEINVYNPEGLPHEMEARQSSLRFLPWQNKLTLAEKYPGLEVGFIKGRKGRTVEWHSVTKKMEENNLGEIVLQKPTRISKIKPVKERVREVTYKPKYEKEKTVTVYNVSADSEGKVQVASVPSESTKEKLDYRKRTKK